MNQPKLSTYLNDHLTGSTGGLELVEMLFGAHPMEPHRETLRELRDEFKKERTFLLSLMKEFEIEERIAQKASGWLTSKLLELKLTLQEREHSFFYCFESLEALSVGIAGKALLWRALRASINVDAVTRKTLVGLSNQAISQRKRVEGMRLEMARSALDGAPRAMAS